MIFFAKRRFWFINLFIILALLGISFWLQYFQSIQPCALCLLQRFVLILLSVSFFLGGLMLSLYWQVLFSFITTFFSTLGMVLAGRQVWLQVYPVAQNNCGINLFYLFKIMPPQKVLTQVLQGTPDCSQITWHFLKLSLAEWSLFFFVLFFIFSLFNIYALFKKLTNE